MSRRQTTWFVKPVILLLLVGGACTDSATVEPPAEGVVLRIVANGDVAAEWTLTDLEEQVTFTDLTIDGDPQSGPLLLDVLNASGVEEWDSGEVIGMSEGRVFEVGLDISSSDVDEGWVLDVTKQGTLKLASAELPRDEWVRDVGEINIP
jgi:hypothetical protein